MDRRRFLKTAAGVSLTWAVGGAGQRRAPLQTQALGDVATPTFYRHDLGFSSGRLHEPSADEQGNLWFSPLDGRLMRYHTATGKLDILDLEQITGRAWNGLHLWPVARGREVYLCSPALERLWVYDAAAGRVERHNFPHLNPQVYGGFAVTEWPFVYLYDTRTAGIVQWDPEVHRGEFFACPYELSGTLYMTFAEPRRKELWGSTYTGNDLVRFDVGRHEWTGHWKSPLEGATPTPAKEARENPDTELAENAAEQALVEGRFGRALDARRARLAAKPQAAYQRPPLTVECWAQLESKSAFNILVANSDKDSNDHWEIYTYAGTGEFSAYLPGYTPSEIKSGVDVTDGRWRHVAMVFDARRVRLFVDGKPVQAVDVTRRETGGTAGSLYFGSYPPQRIGCDGLIDEVRISTVAREIDRVPDGPLEADEHTVGLWRFDEPVDNQFADLSPTNNAAVVRHTSARERQFVADLEHQKRELAKVAVPMVYSGIRKEPDPTYVLLRGDISAPGHPVTAANPAPVRVPGADFELAADATEADRRRKFAQWVAHPDNPLTARVMVNRIWQYHFGRGLVQTPSDFGVSGGRPSHPELLDWLAAEFVRSGGSVKHMHRTIMLSATYRQSSRYNAAAAELDADNRLLWRFAPRRLEAEIVRDAMLAVSGELNRRIGGPSFEPFSVTIFNTYFYHLIDPGTPEYNRRTVYRMNINTARDPLLDALDCPVPSILTPRRRNTVTTLQALALMNDSFVIRQAERFAKRVRRGAGDDLEAQLTLVFRMALARTPSAGERIATVELLKEHGLESACWVLLNSSEFLYLR